MKFEKSTALTLTIYLFSFVGAKVAALPRNLPTKAPVQFVFMGDSGTGESGQMHVAKAIEQVCKERGCQFAIDAGDNIYEYGPKNSNDVQFRDKFEKPYEKLAFPFFMALGNHDQSGAIPGSGVHPERGDYEVEYTKKSDKWVLPERYYAFSVPFVKSDDLKSRPPNPIADFFVIDTNVYAPQNKPQFDWYKPLQEYDKKQRAWLEKGIAESKASWKIVVGHHPYRNNGKMGNAGEFFGVGLSRGLELKKLVESDLCGKVDWYFAGHDHSLQLLKSFPSCGTRPQFMISGASAKNYRRSKSAKSPNPEYWSAYKQLGFFWVSMSPESMNIIAYTVDSDGKPTKQFEREFKK